jgi:putative ABC transport system permease protein
MGFHGQPAFDALVGQEAMLIVRAPRGDSAEFPVQVVGVYEPAQGFDGPFFDAYVGLEEALAIKSWWHNDPDLLKREGYDGVTIEAVSLNDAVQIVEELEAEGFQVTTLKLMLDTINRGMIIVQTLLASVGTLALLVASLGIANTMVMAVYERTREIGILKSIGASRADVRQLFVVEAALIGAMGGVFGVVGGWLLGIGLNQLILAVLRWQEIILSATFFVLRGWLVAAALAFATVVGLLAGLYPAARAARLDPLDALRYE